MKVPQSPVTYSVITPGTRSPSVILPAAMNGLEALAARLQRRLDRGEHALGLAGIVGRVVAHVDVDGHESRFGPGVDREMRLGEEHRSRHALRLELEEAVADDREARRVHRGD